MTSFYVEGILTKNLNSYSLVLSYFYLEGWSVFFVDGFSQMYSENRLRIEAAENVDTHTTMQIWNAFIAAGFYFHSKWFGPEAPLHIYDTISNHLISLGLFTCLLYSKY